MKSAIGNSMLLNIVIIIVSAVILIFVSVLSYSKAYRIKNRIIEIIEKNETFEELVDDSGNNIIENEISQFLHDSGYKVGNYDNCAKAFESKGMEGIEIVHNGGYNYCVGKETTTDNATYYVVITFVEFNFPIVGSISPSAVSGETKILKKNYNDHN